MQVTADELDRIFTARRARLRAENRGDEPAVLLPHQRRRLERIAGLAAQQLVITALPACFLAEWSAPDRAAYAAGDVADLHREAAYRLVSDAQDLLSAYLL